ncbi:MAG: AAA family ATPase [Candidatus Electrothrix scaldis]|nr:MAG: AAA family ATPase [Candidatus Electrothrix sp. GW3-3]
MKKLGLGIQALSEFKDNDFIYVDKTEHIHRLIDDGKYYFLSRPRRFGKSLLINTLKEREHSQKVGKKQECYPILSS